MLLYKYTYYYFHAEQGRDPPLPATRPRAHGPADRVQHASPTRPPLLDLAQVLRPRGRAELQQLPDRRDPAPEADGDDDDPDRDCVLPQEHGGTSPGRRLRASNRRHPQVADREPVPVDRRVEFVAAADDAATTEAAGGHPPRAVPRHAGQAGRDQRR